MQPTRYLPEYHRYGLPSREPGAYVPQRHGTRCQVRLLLPFPEYLHLLKMILFCYLTHISPHPIPSLLGNRPGQAEIFMQCSRIYFYASASKGAGAVFLGCLSI